MPKGVICGGAVDGSNQLGAIVTCQAMTAWPDGAGSPARDGPATDRNSAASSKPMKARRKRWTENRIKSASLYNLALCQQSSVAASAANLQQNLALRLRNTRRPGSRRHRVRAYHR